MVSEVGSEFWDLEYDVKPFGIGDDGAIFFIEV